MAGHELIPAAPGGFRVLEPHGAVMFNRTGHPEGFGHFVLGFYGDLFGIFLRISPEDACT